LTPAYETQTCKKKQVWVNFINVPFWLRPETKTLAEPYFLHLSFFLTTKQNP